MLSRFCRRWLEISTAHLGSVLQLFWMWYCPGSTAGRCNLWKCRNVLTLICMPGSRNQRIADLIWFEICVACEFQCCPISMEHQDLTKVAWRSLWDGEAYEVVRYLTRVRGTSVLNLVDTPLGIQLTRVSCICSSFALPYVWCTISTY
jgi:hypothetical protein